MRESESSGGWRDLTLAQHDFWEEFRFHPDIPVSTVAHCVAFDGAVDEEALAASIAQAVAEADVLALRFHAEGDAPLQRVDPGRRPRLERIDLTATAAPEEAARARMSADIAEPLDLAAAPVSAQWLVKVSDTRWLWYSRGHHIVLDGYSMALIEQRAARLYVARRGGAPEGAVFGAFEDYLDEEAAYRAGPTAAKAGAFWRDYLSSTRDLPVLMKGGEDYGAAPRSRETALDERIVAALRDRAAALGLGWPDLLTLVSAIWLRHELRARAHGQDAPLPVWLPYMSRMGSVSATLPALVVNILPLLVTLSPGETLAAVLARLGRDLRRMRRHGRYRVEQMALDQGIGAGARFFFSPLVNVLPFDPPEVPGATVTREMLAAGPGDGVNLTFASRSDGAEMILCLDADSRQTSETEIDRQMADLTAFLRRSLSDGAENLALEDLLDA